MPAEDYPNKPDGVSQPSWNVACAYGVWISKAHMFNLPYHCLLDLAKMLDAEVKHGRLIYPEAQDGA